MGGNPNQKHQAKIQGEKSEMLDRWLFVSRETKLQKEKASTMRRER